jgi:hypothetical protein
MEDSNWSSSLGLIPTVENWESSPLNRIGARVASHTNIPHKKNPMLEDLPFENIPPQVEESS